MLINAQMAAKYVSKLMGEGGIPSFQGQGFIDEYEIAGIFGEV